ncbi:hypothetical protein U91I_00913 [alpha proteobacterium U9-1i]|nr:hypothetical protein U91I_00913 [alpha proteobacterium U9-1i]
MSDISIQFTWFEWIMLAFVIGWPGLLVGVAIGALAWKRRRWAGSTLGGLAGLLIVFFARLLN